MINKVLPAFGVTLPHAPPLTVSLQMPDEQKNMTNGLAVCKKRTNFADKYK